MNKETERPKLAEAVRAAQLDFNHYKGGLAKAKPGDLQAGMAVIRAGSALSIAQAILWLADQQWEKEGKANPLDNVLTPTEPKIAP
jgi:hypothetical protein